MKLLIIGCFLVTLQNVFAQQTEAGISISAGTARFFSRNLRESFAYRNESSSKVILWDVKHRWGLMFNIGGYIKYNLNSSFALQGELNFGYSRSQTDIDYFEDKLDKDGDGKKESISSEITIAASTFAIPISASYSVGGKIKLSAGIEFLLTGLPVLDSYEVKTTEYYNNFNLDNRETDARGVSARANVFGMHNYLLLGAGMPIIIKEKKLYIDFLWHLPLSRSELYTGSGAFHDIAYKNNEVFSYWGKKDAESEAPQFPLDDFRLTILNISIKYNLYQK